MSTKSVCDFFLPSINITCDPINQDQEMRLKDVRSHPDKRDSVALAKSTDYNAAEA
ncbi:hypothetical protein PHYBLDRAFT_143337 [Phycomyces blakesleeanus NRRL 1555(-)]|uniref:Uncharacterized protein n=1 Tax=Phycomyces blakesleeanus (strain ATCC 8743b / DSM 1359 / FGSC 10004 / NBRC 33097 / NRRL 1555) TaxID=763407 RepID=A0A162UI36_PHYB8|nr:hypothetical protein PHYBLDRAFT_143337 [Phycomyces blakesleeanus NRRL 1555(-)]OAD76362.1 hypothetical protein PHYBLDRAFT_143337 [Phycomyces blakesleeanus NRRL 1555(-)]|eukprot:XP_018294402.1 hypothetical protein PHYBLDRAFT_143337 [Phycomyces blakesleeanus NRRL 1555(-)]